MAGMLEHRTHLVRMAGLFGAGILAFVLLRAVFVPKGFGEYGHYRSGALADNRAREPVFAGRTVCAECHTDVPEAQKGSLHARVGCEACHGALGTHASGKSDVKPGKPDVKTLCLVCHRADPSKPAAFKKVDPKDHGEGAGCTECHDHHNPSKEPQKK